MINNHSVMVVGTGLAGMVVARELTSRRLSVCLWAGIADRNESLGSTSGIVQGEPVLGGQLLDG